MSKQYAIFDAYITITYTTIQNKCWCQTYVASFSKSILTKFHYCPVKAGKSVFEIVET